MEKLDAQEAYSTIDGALHQQQATSVSGTLSASTSAGSQKTLSHGVDMHVLESLEKDSSKWNSLTC